MTPADKMTLIAAGALALWLVGAWATGRYVRPRRVPPAPATPDLRTEPPAVVNLLVNRGVLTGDAARATLIDLAARRIIELYQPTDDPLQPLVRVRIGRPDGLLPHEERVLARVREASGGRGYVPLADLADRHARDGRRWRAEFTKEVRAAAGKAGLTSSWFSMVSAVALWAAALVAGLLASVPLVAFSPPDPPPGAPPAKLPFWAIPSFCCLWLTLLMVLAFVLSVTHDRDGLTADGRAVTAHWLGVGSWLRAHPELAELPAASVAVWDRYLSYGVALGTNPGAARAVDLRVGQVETVWVIRGSSWRRIDVVQPNPLRPHGTPPQLTLGWTLVTLPLWLALAWLGQRAWAQAQNATGYLLAVVLVVAGVLQALRALLRLARMIVDLVSPVTVSGRILSLTPVTARDALATGPPETIAPHGKPRSIWRERWLLLVLDDGVAQRIRPCRVGRSRLAGVQVGDRVVLRLRRFSRYVDRVRRIG